MQFSPDDPEFAYDDANPPPRPLMKTNGFSYIRRWLLLYVAVVTLITLVAYLFVYRELAGILAAGAWTSADTIYPKVPSLSRIQLRILLTLSISFFAIFFLSWLWCRTTLRQINRPINAIRRAVIRLSQGKLNETLALERQDELGQIGAGLNELAANLQELLLHIWKQTGQCLTILDQIKHGSSQLNGGAHPQLLELTVAVENLREFTKAYVFYDVRLDGEHTVAINEPGQKDEAVVDISRKSLSE